MQKRDICQSDCRLSSDQLYKKFGFQSTEPKSGGMFKNIKEKDEIKLNFF